jgi:tellurite methyltransferase
MGVVGRRTAPPATWVIPDSAPVPECFWREGRSRRTLPKGRGRRSARGWTDYYRQTAKRPPRDLVLQLLNRVDAEGDASPGRTAIDLGFGSGTDTLELLRRGWSVLAVDREADAAKFLARRVPARWRSRLTTLVSPMEGLQLPSADLVYASFSLPFCDPDRFPALWSSIRASVRPHGHFAGQLFGDRDEWRSETSMTFHSRRHVARLLRGWNAELLRETDEQGQSFSGPKKWHFFDLILEKPMTSGPPKGSRRRKPSP